MYWCAGRVCKNFEDMARLKKKRGKMMSSAGRGACKGREISPKDAIATTAKHFTVQNTSYLPTFYLLC